MLTDYLAACRRKSFQLGLILPHVEEARGMLVHLHEGRAGYILNTIQLGDLYVQRASLLLHLTVGILLLSRTNAVQAGQLQPPPRGGGGARA